MNKKAWGNVVRGIIIHVQQVYNSLGVVAIDEVKEIFGTAFSIINMYNLKERDYFTNVINWINSRLCLDGYPEKVITEYRF